MWVVARLTDADLAEMFFVVQSLVQARKAGIASAMAARSSIKDEELVRITSNSCHKRVFLLSINLQINVTIDRRYDQKENPISQSPKEHLQVAS